MSKMLKISRLGLLLVLPAHVACAQMQSSAQADRLVTQRVTKAIEQAGINPRVTSVRVVTTSEHVVYLTGLIVDRSKIKLAEAAAAKAAPGYRIVDRISGSFFEDHDHANGCAHCGPAH